jgi:hypothetical protein
MKVSEKTEEQRNVEKDRKEKRKRKKVLSAPKSLKQKLEREKCNQQRRTSSIDR